MLRFAPAVACHFIDVYPRRLKCLTISVGKRFLSPWRLLLVHEYFDTQRQGGLNSFFTGER
jgi:hypothetical protein